MDSFENIPKDNTQDRIIRCACFNNACRLVAPLANGARSISEVTKKAKDVSKELYKENKDWLLGNE